MELIKNAKQAAKVANHVIVVNICNTIDIETKRRNLTINYQVPDCLVYDSLLGIKDIYLIIRRHIITNEYHRWRSKGMFYETTAVVTLATRGDIVLERVTPGLIVAPLTVGKGGFPRGTNSTTRKISKLATIATKIKLL